MPYQVIKYACNNCHKQFDTFEQAKTHEEKCSKCNNCIYGYYVYGCEFNCEFSKECQYPEYSHYKKNKQ